jgi:hypothetical protein
MVIYLQLMGSYYWVLKFQVAEAILVVTPALRSVACSSMVSDLEAHKDKTKTGSDNVRRSYGYKYDNLNRLLKGIYQRGTDPNNTLVLQDLLTNLCQKNQ